MQTDVDQSRDEVGRLQRCMDELAGVLAHPAVGGDPSQVARGLLDTLLTLLGADVVYLRLAVPGAQSLEMLRGAPSFRPCEASEFGAALDRALGPDTGAWPAGTQIGAGDARLSVALARFGSRGDSGVLAAGTRRGGFPSQTDSVMLRVAATQAAPALVRQAPERAAVDPSQIVGRIPGVVLFVMSPSGELESVSAQLTKYFGKTLEQLRHWASDDTVHPDDRARVNETFARAIAAGEPYRFEARFRRADGVYQWFQCRGRPDRDETGRIVRWYAVGIDIDERKRAEERALKAERELQRTLDNIPVRVGTYGADGSHEFINDWVRKTSGISDVKDWRIAIHPDDIERVESKWRACLVSGEPFELEYRTLAHGEYRWHVSRRVPERDAAGKVTRWYAVNYDIEDRKRAEQALRTEIAERRHAEAALRETERGLRSAIDGIPGFVAVLAPNGYIKTVNSRFFEYGGFSLEELRDWATNGIIPGEEIPHLAERLNSAIASGVPYEFEHRMRRADGAYRWFGNRGVPMRDDAGQIACWYVLLTDIEDRKLADEARRQSAARLAAAERDLQVMIDTVPVFVAAYEPDGTRSFVNRRWQEYMGLTLEEAVGPGAKVFPHFHPDDAERNDAAWRASLASGEPLSLQVRVRRADGQYRWHSSERVPLRDDRGNIVRWYSVGIDIHDQKVAEDALRESEARLKEAQRELQLTIDSIPMLVAAYRPDGTRVFVNQTWRNYTGLTLQEATGEFATAFPHFHPDDAARIEPVIRAALASGEPVPYEARLRGHDGEYRWHFIRRVPLRDDDGAIIRWYSTGFDIQDRKIAEGALRQSEARLAEAERELRLTLDLIPTIAWRAARNGYVQSLNKRWYDYTGSTYEQVQNNGWRAFIHPDDRETLAESGRQNIPGGTPIDAEARLLRHDGEYRWFIFRVEPARDESGEIAAWYGTITDIEDRKRAEEAQRRSETRRAETERELRVTLDSIPTITWRAGANGYVQQLNKRWFEYTGTTPEEVRGWRWKLCVHPDDLEELVDIGMRYVASGTSIDGEARLRRHDGTYRWFLFRPAPARDESGNIVAWYGSITDIEDRKQAEHALRQSEARLVKAEREVRRMLDSIPTMTWRAAPNGYVEHINRQAFDYTGKAPEEMAGHLWHHVVHPDDLPGLLAEGNANVPAGRLVQYEARLLRRDGEYRWFLFRLAPSRDETGTIVAWYGSITDIEDRKQAEQALLQSEAQLARAERELRLTLDSIPTMTWRSAPNGFVQQINKQFFDYTGTTPEQMRGRGWQSVVHPEDLTALIDTGNTYVTSGTPIDYEARVRRFDGTYRWFLFRPAPARDEAGNIIAWYGSITDIEDRKRAEEQLRRSETSLAKGQQLSSTGSFSWNVEANELAFSEELCRIFELDQTVPVTFERVFSRIHPEDQTILSERTKLIRNGRNPPDQEIRLRLPDGRIKYLRTVGQIMRHQDGRPEYLGAIQDVTERRLAEESLDKIRSELARVTRVMSLSALTASIAHEVNQPLAGIVTNASTCLRMLAAEPPNIEGARETARRTIRDGNRAADVIARLRSLFSKKAGTTETVDLNDATREVLALAFSDLLRNRVIARVELDEDHPLLVTGDRVQLQQVILNLVRNALDAMSEVNDRPRHLVVKADEAEGHARVIVKDAGVGIEPQGIERLFDAFYTTKDDGMGIGLSVSRSIIESHGGRLWAESNDGPGATFSFSIPRQTTSAGDESAIWMRPTRGAQDPARNA